MFINLLKFTLFRLLFGKYEQNSTVVVTLISWDSQLVADNSHCGFSGTIKVFKSVGHCWMHLLWGFVSFSSVSAFISFTFASAGSHLFHYSLFICLSRATLKQTKLEKTSWIMLLIMTFLGSHALKILFIHMYIHTTRILSPSQGKAKSLKMFKPFVQGRLCESCCVFPPTAAGWFQCTFVCEHEGTSFHHCGSDCTVLPCQQEEVLASCIWEIWGGTFPKANIDRLLIS